MSLAALLYFKNNANEYRVTFAWTVLKCTC